MSRQQHIVEEGDDDIRLDRWFKRHQPGFPHAMLEKQLRKGLIRLDGKKAKSADRIKAGQSIEIRDQDVAFSVQEKKPRPISEDEIKQIQNWVLYKDDNIIVINKPFGLAVQGGSKISQSVDGMLGGLAFDGERPKLVHRLDRDTSGVLVLARNAKVANLLMKSFSSRSVEKTYLALVNGLPELHEGTIDLPLRKKDSPRKQAGKEPAGNTPREYEIVQVDLEEGQKAISHYRILDTLARKFALVELMPETGRLHQLRVHMQSIGCPIVGDHKYGGSMEQGASIGVENVLHLHAWKIKIPSILGGKPVSAKAPLPKHMKESFVALGIDIPR